MRKIRIPLLCLLLSLTVPGCLAACGEGGAPADTSTQTEVTTTDEDTENLTDPETVMETVAETETATVTVTETETETETAPPAPPRQRLNLFKLPQASFTGSNNITLPYRLYVPDDYDESKEYPVLLYMHGAGARGRDNRTHLGEVAFIFANVYSSIYDAIVILPQCPRELWWTGNTIDTLVELMDEINGTYSTDLSRQYVSGGSMGGYGTWDMLLRYPHKVSAALPAGGGGITYMNNADGTVVPYNFIPELLDIPICQIYDLNDDVNPPDYFQMVSQTMVEMGATLYTFHETKGKGHEICVSFVTDKDASMLDWLFAQRRETGEPIYGAGMEVLSELPVENFSASNGLNLPYCVYVPQDYREDRAYPVVVYLQSSFMANKQPNQSVEVAACFDDPESPLYQSIVLIPQGQAFWYKGLVTAVDELWDQVRATYHTDPTRQYVIGGGSGADGAWAMAMRFPQKVTAMLVAGTLTFTPTLLWEEGGALALEVESFDGLVDVTICQVYGTDDPLVPKGGYERLEQYFADLDNAHYTSRVMDGYVQWLGTQFIACDDGSLLSWLFAQSKG